MVMWAATARLPSSSYTPAVCCLRRDPMGANRVTQSTASQQRATGCAEKSQAQKLLLRAPDPGGIAPPTQHRQRAALIGEAPRVPVLSRRVSQHFFAWPLKFTATLPIHITRGNEKLLQQGEKITGKQRRFFAVCNCNQVCQALRLFIAIAIGTLNALT